MVEGCTVRRKTGTEWAADLDGRGYTGGEGEGPGITEYRLLGDTDGGYDERREYVEP